MLAEDPWPAVRRISEPSVGGEYVLGVPMWWRQWAASVTTTRHPQFVPRVPQFVRHFPQSVPPHTRACIRTARSSIRTARSSIRTARSSIHPTRPSILTAYMYRAFLNSCRTFL